jgi:hypothetical protein
VVVVVGVVFFASRLLWSLSLLCEHYHTTTAPLRPPLPFVHCPPLFFRWAAELFTGFGLAVLLSGRLG